MTGNMALGILIGTDGRERLRAGTDFGLIDRIDYE